MNPREQDDSAFDKLADAALRRLERVLSEFDPDEVEADLAGDVLTVVVQSKGKIIINRHRAARQIWMAAVQKAWHFDHNAATGTWHTRDAEFIGTVEQVLSAQLKRAITLPGARPPPLDGQPNS